MAETDETRVLRWWTEWRSGGARRSALYRVEIYGKGQDKGQGKGQDKGQDKGQGKGQDKGQEGQSAREVRAAWEEPGVIEWAEVGKLDPVQGSGLTLQLVSDSDRELTELYTTEAGEWRVRVLRDGGLYWCGTLDTELYEEPYATAEGYVVTVTASDLGVLERRQYEGTGVRSIGALLDEAAEVCGLECAVRAVTSTEWAGSAADSGPASLWDLKVDSANFFDEEGEGMTWREVTEAVLRPLGLRLVQRAGELVVFDLHGAWTGLPEREVWWTDSDQMLGTDVTYDRVTVRLSAYEDTTGLDGSLDHDETLRGAGDGELISMDSAREDVAEGFRVVVGPAGDTQQGALAVSGGARLMRIDAEYSGSDCAGVMWNYKSAKDKVDSSADRIAGQGWPVSLGTYLGEPLVPIMAVGGMRLHGCEDRRKWLLKVSVELLLDVRYNPFEGAGKLNDEGNYGRMEKQCPVMYVPVAIVLRDDAGQIKAWYDNHDAATASGRWREGRWRTDAPLNSLQLASCSWLAWYDWEDRDGKCGIGGWARNRQTISRAQMDNDVPRLWKTRGDGLYISLPPEGGVLSLMIGRGVYADPAVVWSSAESAELWGTPCRGLWRWLAYKDPKVELVRRNGRAAEGHDVEDWAWITRGAKEPLEIETKVGTGGDLTLPTARALLMDASGAPVSRMRRAGVEDRVERLLIATAYSQYGTRRTTLSGTCELLEGLCTLTDASDSDGRYIMLSERQDLGAETSEIKMAQYGPDSWEGLEITSGE